MYTNSSMAHLCVSRNKVRVLEGAFDSLEESSVDLGSTHYE